MSKKAFERLSAEQLVAWWNHYLPEKEEKEGVDLYYLQIFERGHPIRTDEAVSEKYNPEDKWARFEELGNRMESTNNPLPWIDMKELEMFFNIRSFAVRKMVHSENIAVFDTLEDAVNYAISIDPSYIVVELNEFGQVIDKWPA